MTVKKAPPKKKTVKKKRASVTKISTRQKKAPRRRLPSKVRQLVEFAHDHRVPAGQLVGRPIELMDWQIDWLIATFQPYISVSLLSVARRAGKTALVAIIVAAGLYGPLVVPNAMIISASRSLEQAALVYKYVESMAVMSGFDNQLVFRASKKEIFCPRTGVEYKAVSADAKTQHGKSANILITDELGQVRGEYDELYETLSSGQGSYAEPKHLIISTRAPNDNDLFNILIADAQTGLDPNTAVTVYEADEDCDLLDEKQWLKANPSIPYGVLNIDDLRRQARQASRIPSKEASFRNLKLNQKVDSATAFITAGVWKRGNREVNEALFLDPNNYVYGGLDLSARRDITSLVLSVEDPETNEIHIKCYAWTPEEGLVARAKTDRVPYDAWVKQGWLTTVPGNAIHYAHVAPMIAEIVAKYGVYAVNFDRWHIEQLMYEFDEIGAYINLIPHGQGYKDMSPAIDELESILVDELLVHGGNPILTNHISNVVITTDPTNARKMDKSKSVNKIDCAVALGMSTSGVKKTMGDEGGGAGLYGSDESAKHAVI